MALATARQPLRLTQAPSREAFVASPADAWVATRSLLGWQEGSARAGVVVMGRFDLPAIAAFFDLLEMDLAPSAQPHVSIVDFRGVTYTDLGSMGRFHERLLERMPRFAAKVTKRLILTPKGELGIAFGGLLHQVPPLYPVHIATELEPELPWLGIAPDDPILEWLELRRAELFGAPEVLQSLRLALEAGAQTIDACARRIGCSPRSLQRSLQASGTSFRAFRVRHRVERAQHLLANSNASVSEIALTVGFATAQHFATAFRSVTGTTPAAFRQHKTGQAPNRG